VTLETLTARVPSLSSGQDFADVTMGDIGLRYNGDLFTSGSLQVNITRPAQLADQFGLGGLLPFEIDLLQIKLPTSDRPERAGRDGHRSLPDRRASVAAWLHADH